MLRVTETVFSVFSFYTWHAREGSPCRTSEFESTHYNLEMAFFINDQGLVSITEQKINSFMINSS